MINLSLNLTQNPQENLTNQINNSNYSNYSFSDFQNEFVLDVSSSFSLNENLIYILLSICLFVFAVKIFLKANKISKQISIESINSFSKSFLFYSLFFFTILIFLIFEILNYYFPISTSVLFYSYFLLFIPFIIFPWIARTYLLHSILFKHYYDKLPTKFSQRLFLFSLSFLIVIDFLFSIFLFVISEYLYLGYNLIILFLFVYFIYKKEGKSKIFKQIPQLTIILLLILRLTSSFEFLFDNENSIVYFEYFTSIITILIYFYIYLKLKKWEKILINAK